MKQKNIAKLIFQIGIAALLLITAIVGYAPEPQYMYELTFLSNSTIGLLFLISGIRTALGKKDLPNALYGCGLATIMLVFLTCMLSLSGLFHMNFSGAFLFLHVVNPLCVAAYYFIFIDEKVQGKRRNLFLVPCFALGYLLVDYIVGEMGGKFAYGFFKPAELTIPYALLAGILTYALILAVGFLLFALNRLFRKAGKALSSPKKQTAN